VQSKAPPDAPKAPPGAPWTGAMNPVFVLGPPRSGAMLLAWSLGQHAALRLLPDAAWIGGLAEGLQQAATRAGAAPSSMDHFLEMGRAAIESLAGDTSRLPQVRWVHASPDNALHVTALQTLYPRARFIHVVRDVGSVVHALAEQATPDGSYFTQRSACELWLRTVRACLDAERTLGREVVLRVDFADLLADPESVVRRCLQFVGEPSDPACLRPLNGLEPAQPAPHDSLMLPAEARALSERLVRRESTATRQDEPAAREYREVLAPVDQMRVLLRTAVPPGSIVLVISKGDDDLVRLSGRHAWHFPQARDGVYAGHHPADTASIVAHLHELRERGAAFLFIPCTAMWWLTHYRGLREYLERQHRLVAYHEDLGVVFALRSEFQPAPIRAVLTGQDEELTAIGSEAGIQPVEQEVIR
jgi:hypothetical protein